MEKSRREAVIKLRDTLDEAIDYLSDSDLREVRAYACALYDMKKRFGTLRDQKIRSKTGGKSQCLKTVRI